MPLPWLDSTVSRPGIDAKLGDIAGSGCVNDTFPLVALSCLADSSSIEWRSVGELSSLNEVTLVPQDAPAKLLEALTPNTAL